MIYQLLPTRVYRSYLGGKNLDRMMKKEKAVEDRFPEDWLGSVTKAFNPGRNIENEGLSVTQDGRFLKTVIEENREAMIGNRKNMSLLFKLLDAAERLVIQVHPTVAFAQEHFHSDYGKTECWYILNDGGYVYIGFREGITKEYWKNLFDTQNVEAMLSCLHKFQVKKGDFIFVAGGVPHAIGAGCFLAELQEPTDLMVIPEKITPSGIVLADEKIHGGLGFEKMFDCFVYEGKSRTETRTLYFREPVMVDTVVSSVVDDTVTDKFKLDRVCVKGNYEYRMQSYAIAVVLAGHLMMNGMELVCGDRVFISENEGNIYLNGNADLLLCRP